MVRRRGGGTGQGQGQDQGGKRQATTPVGGVYKDPRRNIRGDEEYHDYDDEEEWTQVARNKPKSPPKQTGSGSGSVPNTRNQPDHIEHQDGASSRPSFASITAQASTSATQYNQSAQSTSQHLRRNSDASVAAVNQKKTLDRIFKTAPPSGPMRDDITVEILNINGKPFKGQLTFSEAKDGIFVECLDLNIKLIHGIRFRFNTFPTIKFKLKEQINVDELFHREYFEFKRHYKMKGEWVTDVFECKIAGIRSNTGDQTQPDSDPNVRWVKIEWTDYAIEEELILDWLKQYGEPVGELSEELHQNSDSDADPIGNGTLSIKMRLSKDIPQLIPMWGKRIRVYYRGVQKLCSNCFGPHPRKNCRSERVSWVSYCLRFMENHKDIPQEMYGKWWKVVNEHFGQIIEEGNENEMAEEETESNQAQQNQPPNQNQSSNQDLRRHEASGPNPKRPERLSREDEENLSDYLKLGMSITEAKEFLRKETEMAEIKMKIRENKRSENRGAIDASTRTRFGPSAGSGRGGLSFN